MSESKFTPWTAKPDPDSDGEWLVLVRDGDAFRAVAACFGWQNEALLAAAAPELYGALHEAREALNAIKHHDTHALVAKIDAALAKAVPQ